MSSFANLGVRSDVVTRLNARGITEPFPIQAATIADALSGRDVCGKAPTGSGKTIAFGIPLVCAVEGKAAPRAPRGLVLVPTRELANQVAEELRELAGPKGRVATVYGGVGYGDQLRALRRGADIVVACPGRLKDLVERNEIRLDEVSFVVIDEADRMADMGFLPEVRRLLDIVRDDRQTLLFSATLDGDIKELIERFQKNPVRHEVEGDEDAPENTHVFWKTSRADRVQLTATIASTHWPAVVFCRTKHGTERLAEQLEKLGVKAAAIHGDKSQSQREKALNAFQHGRVQALVATDVAARGIHVDDVACVVHYDPTTDDKDYIHRSGRTGRAGAAGLVISIVLPEQVKASLGQQRRLGFTPSAERPEWAELKAGAREFVAKYAPPPVQRERKPKFDRRFDTKKPEGDATAATGRQRKPYVKKSYTPRPVAERGERAERAERTDAPAKPWVKKSVAGRKPQGSNTWGADRPKGTGHPRKGGPSASAPKPHRKGQGQGGSPGRVGGVRREGRPNR